MNSHQLLYYAQKCTQLLWISSSRITLMFYLLMQKSTCLSSLLSLMSMEFFKVFSKHLYSTAYPVSNWHKTLKCNGAPGCFLPFSFQLIRKYRGWLEFAMNTAACWNTLRGGSLENAFHCLKDFVFQAIEIICIWKSERFLIFDQIFHEVSTSMFMKSVCDIIK